MRYSSGVVGTICDTYREVRLGPRFLKRAALDSNCRLIRRKGHAIRTPQSHHDQRRSVCGGRPCIHGLRIRVIDVLELLGADASFDENFEDYPYVEREDILASMEYAARQTDHSVLQSA